MKFSLLMLLIAGLTGCASLAGIEKTSQTFTLKSGNQIVVIREGCSTRGATFINTSDKNISLILGTLITIQKETKATLEQFQLNCPPTLAGGSSKCSVSLTTKDVDLSQYGGMGCPSVETRIGSLMVK